MLTALGLMGLLLAILSFSFDGVPAGLKRQRRRPAALTGGEAEDEAEEEAAPAADGSEAAGEAVIAVAVLELPSELASPQPVPAARVGWPRRARSALSGLLYLAVVVGAIVTIPNVLSWALDSPNPIAAVTGSSMWPTLQKGDLVLLQGVDGVEDLEVGDIIAFRQQRGFSIHRVVNIDGEKITTRGDGNFVDDSPINIENVIGKVPKVGGRLARLPLLGHLSLILGPLVSRDNGFSTQESLSQPVPDLAEQERGRILGPVEDLSKLRLAEDSDGSTGDSNPGTPVDDLLAHDQPPDAPAVTGSPVEELTSAE